MGRFGILSFLTVGALLVDDRAHATGTFVIVKS